MKTLKFLSLCFGTMAVMLTACSKNEENVVPEISEQQTASVEIDGMREANLILVEYLELQDEEHYVLNISQVAAEQLGVSKEFYLKAVSDVADANKAIQAAKIRVAQDAEHCSLEIIDPQLEKQKNQRENNLYSRASGVNPYNPFQGSLKTGGFEVASKYWPQSPTWLKGVKFYCLLNVMAGGLTCKTYSFGTWMEKTVVGTFVFNREVEVGVAASGVPTTVSFETTNQYGGVAAYEGMGWPGY